MSWAHVQGTGTNTNVNSGNLTATFGSNVTAGNLIVVSIVDFNAASSVTDNQSNTYTLAKSQHGTQYADIWYTLAGSSGSLTVTIPANYSVLAIDEFSFTGTRSVDGTAGASATSTTPASGNITLTGTDLICAIAGTQTTGTTWTAGSGYTLAYNVAYLGAGHSMGGAAEYQLNDSSSPANPGFTYDVSGAWDCAGVAFLATVTFLARSLIIDQTIPRSSYY